MSEIELSDAMRDQLRASWHVFLDQIAPIRPDLYRYCRRLTRNAWDAEDLVQDSLLRAFGTLGRLNQELRNPRAYLLRTATNVWIDVVRRRTTAADADVEPLRMAVGGSSEPAMPDQVGSVRDAGAALMQKLSPQERCAVVLKDVFDLSLDETARVLDTSVGAIKAALHRGRGRLHDETEMSATEREAPSAALVDAFVSAFTSRDLETLLGLMLENSAVELVGCGLQYGEDAVTGKNTWFDGVLGGHPEWPREWHYEAQRFERAVYLGEPILLHFRTRRGREKLEVITRFEERDGRATRVRSYGFCPETMREVGEALGHPVRTGPYRFPTPAPGESYVDPE